MRRSGQKMNLSGIELAAPRLTGHTPPAALSVAFGFLMTLLGVLGAEWCFISIFAVPVLPLTVFSYSFLFVLALTAVYRLNRIRYPILLLLTLGYAWVGYRLGAEIVQGFLITTNRIMFTYAAHTSFVLPVYRVTAQSKAYAQLCTVFILYAGFFVCLLLSWAVARQQSFALTFLITLPFPAAGLIFNIVPDYRAVMMLVTCWTVLLFTRIPGGSTLSLRMKGSAYRAVNPAAAAKAGLQLLPAVLLCIALVLAVFPRQSYRYSGKAEEIRSDLTEATSRLSLFDSGDALAGSSDHVNLKGADSIRYTGKTMLKVQMTEPHSAYLKGFTGSVYKGTSWERLPDADYQGIDRSLGGMDSQNMSSKFLSLIKQELLAINPGGYGLKVQNVGANKRLIYAPYNLTTTPDNITGVKFVHDGDIRSDWMFGTGEYTLYANSFNGGRVNSNVPGLVSALYQAARTEDGVNTRSLQREMNGYINDYRGSSTTTPEAMRVFYTGWNQQEIPEAFDSARKSFLQTEQAYRLLVYDKYTQLPEDVKKKVSALMQEQGITDSGAGRGSFSLAYNNPINTTVDAVKAYLADHYTYTLSPGTVPAGKDFTEYFLFDNPKGYCVHFATAATVMLRAAGIPARYAEGYLVTADDFKNATDGWASIPDSRAHAWVEVYYPGLGWQPVEMTPGFNAEENLTQSTDPSQSAPSAPAESGTESSTSSAPESETESRPQSQASSAAPAVPGSDDKRAAMAPLLVTAAAVAILLAAAVLRRKLAAMQRNKRFAQPDRNNAALSVYGYLERLTRFGGEIPENITEIALKARFSQHTVSEEEVQTMRGFAEHLAVGNLRGASAVNKFMMKYIYCLV